MARIRTIKPEFWASEQIVECSPMARLLFVGIWTFADDGGVHPDSPKRLKMEVFPADEIAIDAVTSLVEELVAAGLLLRFEAEGKPFLWVTGWKHQKIDRPTMRHPRPPLADGSTSVRRATAEQSPTPPPRSRVESNGVESSGKESISIDRGDRPTIVEDFQKIQVDAAEWESILPVLEKSRQLITRGNLRNLSATDRETVIRCVLVAKHRLPIGDLEGILSRLKQNLKAESKDNPAAYFRQAFINACADRGIDFHPAAASFVVPDTFLRPPTGAPAVAIENTRGIVGQRKPEAAPGRELAEV